MTQRYREKLDHIMYLKNVKRGRISEYINNFPIAAYYEDDVLWGISRASNTLRYIK